MMKTTALSMLRLARPVGAVLSGLCLGFLGSCSGGAGGSDEVGPANAGSYTADDFDYVDPNPAAFHPLGTASTVINELAEQMVIIPYDKSSGAGTGGEETIVWIDESEREGFGQVPGTWNLFGEDLAIRHAASGNLDDDGAKEWVATEINNDGNEVVLYYADRGDDGIVETGRLLSFDPGSFAARDASIQLCDLDGDFRDELIVVARSNYFNNRASSAVVRVFDDPESGAANLLTTTVNRSSTGFWATPADVDGDGLMELVVATAQDAYPNAKHAVRMYQLNQDGTGMELVHGWRYLDSDPVTSGSKSVLGDFDGDGRDEIAVCRTFAGPFSGQMVLNMYEWEEGELEESSDKWIQIPNVDDIGDHFWVIEAFDRRVGQDEIALLAYHSETSKPWRVTLLTYDELAEGWTREAHDIVHRFNGQYPALCAGDINADGSEELQWGLLRGYNQHADLWRGYLSNDPNLGYQNFPKRTFPGNQMRSRAPVLVSGDWDADGLLVSYTGRKFLQMASPVPIVVLSAPPTKANISQNFDDTEVYFETTVEGAETWGVTVATTLSASAGAEFDFFGLITAGGKATIEDTLESTQTITTKEITFSGYSGTSTADQIIFQGTLQQAYEYVVLDAPDPEDIGRYLTLNIPADSQIYSWTVDYYNAQVSVEDRIDTSFLTHTPGDVESYPTSQELIESLEGTLHWKHETPQGVSEGQGSTAQGIAFETETTTHEQRTVTTSIEGEVALGISGSAGSSTTESSFYSVTLTDGSMVTTTVGAIDDDLDHHLWRYNWGMAIQTYGRTADEDNNPTGYVDGQRPFQYVRYWVDRVGAGYKP